MQVIVFEDPSVARLYPITVGRPAYAISCGSYRLIDLLERFGAGCRTVVRAHLAEIERLRAAGADPGLAASGPVLLVNARIVPSASAWRELKRIADSRQFGVARRDGHVAAALVPPEESWTRSDLSVERLDHAFRGAAFGSLPALEADLPLLEYPHDVVRYNMAILQQNLEDRLAGGEYREVADGVFAAEGASLGQFVATQTRSGPVVLDRGASIGPYCYLSGPAYLGVKARVIEHAAIKDAVSIGHTTKIGGEVEASVIEPYTNKQHHGFLGHSYLGSWINLGAGTCNSDLKNTYGPVKMEYAGEKVATGMQFLGCIVGDYSKSAINTGIFTGKTVGVCSMVYGFVTTNVPSFVNYARLFGQVTELPPEVMVATQERMFRRRDVPQRPCDIQLIHDMYRITVHERQLAGQPLAL